ncbi:hypothetical protein L0Y65_05535 [Candidatus Micrarchaeota archaeon]|nr:hypothetical protein [Candidatus Micrarchaeota archaeon]
MKDVRIRLLHPPSVKPEEVGAAIRGMERFRAFGVQIDNAELGENCRAVLNGVRNGGAIKNMVNATAPAITFSDFHGGFWEALASNDILPLGLTPSCMNEIVYGEYSSRLEIRLGLSREKEGAIVSLFRIRGIASTQTLSGPYRTADDAGLALKAIETAVVHELGHVLGKTGHCESEGCVMQANSSFEDFINRFVRPGLDFCRECARTVNMAVCRMTTGY